MRFQDFDKAIAAFDERPDDGAELTFFVDAGPLARAKSTLHQAAFAADVEMTLDVVDKGWFHELIKVKAVGPAKDLAAFLRELESVPLMYELAAGLTLVAIILAGLICIIPHKPRRFR